LKASISPTTSVATIAVAADLGRDYRGRRRRQRDALLQHRRYGPGIDNGAGATGANSDLRDLLVAVRARVSGVGDQRRAPAPNNRLGQCNRQTAPLLL
jgi:hypothetical protein